MPSIPDHTPLDLTYWASPALNGELLVAYVAALRSLLEITRQPIVNTKLGTMQSLVSLLGGIRLTFARGRLQRDLQDNDLFQLVCSDLGEDPAWRAEITAFIQSRQYQTAIARKQYVIVTPILLPRPETALERSQRFQRIMTVFRRAMQAPREEIVESLVANATAAFFADPRVNQREIPTGAEWVLEATSLPYITEDMDRFDSREVYLLYPQEGFPDSLSPEERIGFRNEMHYWIARVFIQDYQQKLLAFAVSSWRRLVHGDEQERSILRALGPALPIADPFTLPGFGQEKRDFEERITFLRTLREFQGHPVVDEAVFFSSVLNSITLDRFFSRQWSSQVDGADGGPDASESLAELAKKLGLH